MKPLRNLQGQRFGRLAVTGRAFPNYRGNAVWECACDCGNRAQVIGPHLTRGLIASCGCLRRERALAAVVKHGQSKTPVYNIWIKIRDRCQNVKNRDYRRYGGRGIKVCDRWQTFENFYADMGHPPPGMTIERQDNDGPYSPDNCVWADRKTQRRNTSTNLMVQVEGALLPLAVACERLRLKRRAVYMRMRRGMSFSEAVSFAREGIEL
jgi:hypothetical protein